MKRLVILACFGVAAVGSAAARSGVISVRNGDAVSYAAQANPETLVLDATTAGRGFVTSTLHIPARPGPLTLVYPEWIGAAPTGPISAIAQFAVTGNGKSLGWHRDTLNLYAFHVQVPAGVSAVEVRFISVLNTADAMSTHNLALINWDRMLVYQSDIDDRHYYVKASVILPPGWGYATALTAARSMGQRIDFTEVSLDRLVDSPLACGHYYKEILLWQAGNAHDWLDIFADDPRDLDMPRKVLDEYQRMTPEALALFGSRHWYDYRSLLLMSNKIGFNGLEIGRAHV